MEETSVVIVGAGPAGLGIAACLTTKFVPHIVLEKEDCCASLWKKRVYDRCHLHLAKEFCSLPLKPHSPQANKYMTKNEFIQYLDDYVSKFKIRPRFFHCVVTASFNEANGKWLIEATNTLLNVTKVFVANFLVIASGENGRSYVPNIPGLKGFKGKAIHSSDYKSGHEFQDKNVLVVGCGNSGMEIAYDLCHSGANASIVIRNPVHVVSRGFIYVGMHLMKYLSLSMVDTFLTLASKFKYGNLSKYGIHRPKEGPFFLKTTLGRSPVIDVGTIEKIQSGEIKVFPSITSIKESKVVFENEVQLQFDAIIFATGFESAACEWLKDFDFILKEDGFPKNRYPKHWKGNNGLYCAGLGRMGLKGVANDAIAIASDIEKCLYDTLASKGAQ